MNNTKKLPRGLVAITWLLAAWSFGPRAAFSAETVLLNCTVGTEVVHYAPGITNDPKPTVLTATSVATACAGVPLGVSNAILTLTGSGNIGCEGSDSDTAYDILWSDNTTSSADVIDITVQRSLGQILVIDVAVIVSGRFAGATVRRVLTLLQTELAACSTPEGVLSAGGTMTLTVTSPLL
jgi:hypothetical protein